MALGTAQTKLVYKRVSPASISGHRIEGFYVQRYTSNNALTFKCPIHSFRKLWDKESGCFVFPLEGRAWNEQASTILVTLLAKNKVRYTLILTKDKEIEVWI